MELLLKIHTEKSHYSVPQHSRSAENLESVPPTGGSKYLTL